MNIDGPSNLLQDYLSMCFSQPTRKLQPRQNANKPTLTALIDSVGHNCFMIYEPGYNIS